MSYPLVSFLGVLVCFANACRTLLSFHVLNFAHWLFDFIFHLPCDLYFVSLFFCFLFFVFSLISVLPFYFLLWSSLFLCTCCCLEELEFYFISVFFGFL